MRKVVYLSNSLDGLVQEIKEKTNGKKLGDRLSISAYYGGSNNLFRQSEIDASICTLYRETETGLRQLACQSAGSKIIFQLIEKEEFEKLFTIKESKPKAKADTIKAEPAQAEPAQAEPAKEPDTVQADTVREQSAEYTTVSAFEQVKALIPSLTAEEKQELLKLLKK